MVLQRDVVIPVRGTATDEKNVVVVFNGNEYVSGVENGRWEIELPPMPAGGRHTIEVRGSNTVVLKNITFGDIWLCAGQSNMDSPIEVYKRKFPDLYEGHPVKEHDQIRIFRTGRVPIDTPQEFIEREHRFSEGWYPIAPKTRTRLFTATGYFFGVYLAEEVEVPIGLIQSWRGGTPITAWMPPGVLEQRDEYAHILDEYQEAVQAWPSKKAAYEQEVKQWEMKKAAGEKVGWKPEPPLGPESVKRPYALHNGMIAPLYQLPIKGVLWYQGEGNSRTREGSVQYEILLQDLVAHWRTNWGNESMPFLVLAAKGTYHRARGTILEPDKVRIEHPGIKTPSSIRYAWENYPNCNLFGGHEMPAFPFRTDRLSALDE